MNVNHKDIAYPLLRVSVGCIFLTTGIGKLMTGPDVFANSLVEQFANTPLPPALVRAFGMALPFIEVTVGSLMLLGLFTLVGLVVTSLLMMGLTFGMMLIQQPQVVAQNLLYSTVLFFLIFYHEYNAFAIDNLFHRDRSRPVIDEGSTPIRDRRAA